MLNKGEQQQGVEEPQVHFFLVILSLYTLIMNTFRQIMPNERE